MKARSVVHLVTGILMFMSCLQGCANVQTTEMVSCDDQTEPASYKIYLFVSGEKVADKSVQILRFSTNMSLVKQGHEVELINDPEMENRDGISLRIDINGIVRDPDAKSVGIQYVLTDNATQRVMHYKYEESDVFTTSDPIASKAGKVIAREVDGLLNCIQGRGNVKAGAIADATTGDCGKRTPPDSYKIYLYVSEDESFTNIVRSLRKKTDFSLFQLKHEVAVLENIESMGSDGLLLKIDIVGNIKSIASKRIGIRYRLINNASGEVLFLKVEEMGSRLGAERITTKMAQNIASDVDEMVRCLRNPQPAGAGSSPVQ